MYYIIYIRISVIDNKILCVHGGLSPSITTLDQIRSIDRKVKISVIEGPLIILHCIFTARGPS